MFVRLALESDCEAIVEIARRNSHEWRRPHVFNPDRVRAVFRKYLDTAEPTIFVCERRGQVIGFLKAGIRDYDYADGLFTTIDVVFVLPENRGSRAALLLVREFIRWSDMLGAEENLAGVDNNRPERFERFLCLMGFRRIGYSMRRLGAGPNAARGR